MLNWLKKRLSPVKIITDRWTELAEAIEEYFAAYFDPDFNELSNSRSIYTASPADQQKKIQELGGYYEDDMPADNQPVLLAQRKFEMLQKESVVPLMSVLHRIKIDASWQPLYMLPNAIYGEHFYTEDQLTSQGQEKNQCLLTSRGILKIDVSKEPVLQEIADLAIRRCRGILPLHILYDGCRLFAVIKNKNMPKIAIMGLVSEIVTTNPYNPSVLEIAKSGTKISSGYFIQEIIEIRTN